MTGDCPTGKKCFRSVKQCKWAIEMLRSGARVHPYRCPDCGMIHMRNVNKIAKRKRNSKRRIRKDDAMDCPAFLECATDECRSRTAGSHADYQ